MLIYSNPGRFLRMEKIRKYKMRQELHDPARRGVARQKVIDASWQCLAPRTGSMLINFSVDSK